MSFVPPLNIGPLADRELHDLKRRYAAKTEHEVSHDFIRPSDSYIAAAKAFFKLAIYYPAQNDWANRANPEL
ncbi:MAG: hypothetical protein AB7T49_00015 [Oligoflexales bacterium]